MDDTIKKKRKGMYPIELLVPVIHKRQPYKQKKEELNIFQVVHDHVIFQYNYSVICI